MKKTDYLFINIIFSAALFALVSLFLMQDAHTVGSIAWCIKQCKPHSLNFLGVALLPFYIALMLFASSVVGFHLGRLLQRKRLLWIRSSLRSSSSLKTK